MFEPRVPVAPSFSVSERVSADMTSEDVAALAPDAKVAAAGRKLGAPKSWESPGRSDDALWGECRGSAVYQVRVDLSDLAVKCSCPSRKHPCKHGIGLLFLHLETPLPTAPAPDWVTDWLASRAASTKARKSAGKRKEAVPDPEAKEKRARKRLSRVAAGLEALDLWTEDLVRDGLATGGTWPVSFWETQAKRMVDAHGWNYARLLTEGLSEEALVESPMMNAMRSGRVCRIEELTRIAPEVQDTLITVLSEKTLPVPELNTEVQARKGFNVIATANNRDKGVNELSSALTRRFNTVILPVPETMDEEVEIVERRVASLGRALELPAERPAMEEIRRVVTVFRELRGGVTEDGKTKLKSPTGTLSTAEAISVLTGGLASAAFYGDGTMKAGDVAAGITGAVVKDPVQDRVAGVPANR